MGNNGGKSRGAHEAGPHDVSAPPTPGQSPMIGSPLTFSPQVPMDPSLGGLATQAVQGPVTGRPSVEFQGVSGWPAQPMLMPTVIIWSHGGQHVEVEGSFDNWTSRTALQRSGRDFTIVKLLSPGVYQYKFIVDGVWRYAPDQPAMYDEMGNINNVIEVHEFVPENLDGLEGFEPPPSPSESYSRPPMAQDDFAKDAPHLPQHLHLTLLNVPPAMDPTTSLPRPQHVILQHLYTQRQSMGSQATRALVLGLTRRYRSKYITTIMYKPGTRRVEETSRSPSTSQGDGQADEPMQQG